jgi:hypothetical protein
MRVAVVFFGMVRALPETLDSIRAHIIGCNAVDGIELKLFASLNLLDVVRNPRSGEHGLPLDPGQVLQLGADAYHLVRQDDADIAPLLDLARLQRDPYRDDYASIRNLLQQLRSLDRAWRLIHQPAGRSFDLYLFVRPDLRYLTPIRITDLAPCLDEPSSLLVPSWHSWGGLNDRFALAGPVAAQTYATRIGLVPAYCAEAPLHAEKLLRFALTQARCKVGALPVFAERVRTDGATKAENFALTNIMLPSRPELLQS